MSKLPVPDGESTPWHHSHSWRTDEHHNQKRWAGWQDGHREGGVPWCIGGHIAHGARYAEGKRSESKPKSRGLVLFPAEFALVDRGHCPELEQA